MTSSADAALPFIPANQIPVRDGRFILFWPLALRMASPPETSDAIGQAVKRAARNLCDTYRYTRDKSRLWKPVDDPIQHIQPADGARGKIEWENETYAESVYFHDFVQSFLFRGAKDDARSHPPVHLFRRTDVRGAEVEWGGKTRHLDVERTNLYLFSTGAAVLVCELHIAPRAGEPAWTLADAQDFHDYFRRAYAPFFLCDDQNGKGEAVRKPGFLVVDRVSWLDGAGNRLAWKGDWEEDKTRFDIAAALSDVDRLLADRDGPRHPPVFAHWRALLGNALPLGGYAPEDRDVWRHVVDERMLTLAAISVTGVGAEADAMFRRIRPGDFMRLCFADDKGEADYPYDPDFLKDFDKDFAYDRFRSMGTRYLISGYAFVAVGAGDRFDTIVMMHMRRHYFQMMLLANLELASLLGVSGQITGAVQAQERAPDPLRFERNMAAIQEEFLQFVHRFRFTGVSNQVQARELFGLLRKKLDLDPLFNDVQTELNNAAVFLRSRAQERATEAQTQLNMLAGVGVVLATALALLSSGFLFDETTWKELINSGSKALSLSQRMKIAGAVFAGSFGAGALLLLLIGWLSPNSRIHGAMPQTRLALALLALSGMLGLLCAIFMLNIKQ